MGSTFSYYKTIATNLVLSFTLFAVCRIFFLVYNLSYFPEISTQTLLSIFKGGVTFDIAALCYINALYIVLMCIPLISRYKTTFQKFTKWTFVLPNAIAIVMNMADVVYFRFTGKRTTASIFKEFSNESNILTIFTNSILTYIPVTIAGILLIYVLIKLYRSPK
ncbi:MAG: LTA synthase family protein, partial [Tannerellaceae bacterium]